MPRHARSCGTRLTTCLPQSQPDIDGGLHAAAESLVPKIHDIAFKLFGRPYESLDETTRRVTRHIAERTHVTRNPADDPEGRSSWGQRAADAVASFGGSWIFVGLFAGCMLTWVGLNAALVLLRGSTFDPYPYILLNLFLSMLAAIQAPIILMSQNRQSEKDRLTAAHDYEVNLKAELEIMLLHEKLDLLRQTQWSALLELQHQQLGLLQSLASLSGGPGTTAVCADAQTSPPAPPRMKG